MNNYDYFNTMNYCNDYPQQDDRYIASENTKGNSYAGFVQGNLFDTLYDPYKNMTPIELTPLNEQEALMDKVREYNFAALDLNLYLDNYPNSKDAVKLFNDYRKLSNTTTNEYERLYGPLSTKSDALDTSDWVWNNGPWPWEGTI